MNNNTGPGLAGQVRTALRIPIRPKLRRTLRQCNPYTETPDDTRCYAELALAAVQDDLRVMTQALWAERWKCSRSKVRRIASDVATVYPGGAEWRRLADAFPHLDQA